MKRSLILVFSCLALPLSAWAQNTASVHVLDPNQKPIANATVAFRIWGEKKPRQGTLHTDATGTATLPLEKPIDPNQPIGRIVVHAKGFAIDGLPISSNSLELKLLPGALWHGVVVDSAGKPVAGATVKASSMLRKDAAQGDFLIVNSEEMAADFTTTSAADGSFQIGDLPPGGSLGYLVIQPGFAMTGPEGQSSVAEAARVVLPPEAKLHGQLLGTDGKPLVGVRVYAHSQEGGARGGEAKTADDGTYTIGALSAAQYMVGAEKPEGAPYLIPNSSSMMAEAGKTREVPPLRAIQGMTVSGIVRDKATGKPLAGAGVTASNPATYVTDSYSELTGDDGKFTMQVLPGNNRFYLNRTPDDFLADIEGQALEIGVNAPAPLTFELQKAPLLTGTIVDENNRPIKAQLRVASRWERATVTSDAQGKWSWKASRIGTIPVSGGEDENGYYEVVAGKEWKAPSATPIVVKVRKRSWKKLEGRVVSRAGQPLAGVEVRSTFFVDMGEGGRLEQIAATATTDAEGKYLFPRMRAENELSKIVNNLKVSATSKELAYIGGGTIARQGEDWAASDIVLSALNRRIEGQTLAGARVVAAGKETLADGAGHFVFEGLPDGETLVCAALGGKFGSVLVGDGQEPVKIELAPLKAQGLDVELGRDAWREVARQGGESKFFALDWVSGQLGTATGKEDGFESLKRTDDGPTTTMGDWNLASKIAKWAPRLPAEDRVARLETVVRGVNRPEIRLMAWLDAAIKSQDENVGKRALQEAETALELAPPEFMWRELNLYRLAVVTEKVEGAKAGEEALNRAIKWTFAHNPEKPHIENGRETGGSRDDMLRLVAGDVAQGSDAMLHQVLTAIDPESGRGVWAMSEAIPVVARAHGIEVALPLLEELLKMPKPESTEGRRLSNYDPQFGFNTAARKVMPLLAAKSPQRALELARRITDESGRARSLAVVAQFETPAEAAKLWREAIQSVELDEAARMAAQAWERDPKVGAELFDVVLQRVKATRSELNGRTRAWPAYGFYFARVDAASARLELEREWAAQRTSTQGDSGQLSLLAMGMSAIDGVRALEMARAIPKGDDNFWPLETMMKIPQYLMATPEQRRDFPFNRWGATDTWQPGDEEW